MNLTFGNMNAVVTGGGSGMGKAIARRLAEGGARVAVVDINGKAAEDVAASLPGGKSIAVAADVSREADVARYVDAAVKAFGRIDLFANNAGLLGKAGPLVDATLADYEHVFGINMRGAFLGMRDVIRQMLTQGGGGAVVTTASIAGLRGVSNCSLYSASKFAVLGLTRSAAKEYGPRGIRVNAVCPGVTETAFTQFTPETKRSQAANIPLGRIAQPDEIANAVIWLLSDAASFANGAVLAMDGGQAA
jgi:NAD(P)-dependent dehydrogenase (short-subunit alcohol dehydrogenase family)